MRSTIAQSFVPKLNITDERAVEQKAIMDRIKELSPTLIDWDQIIRASLVDTEAIEFSALKDRGLFCDGFMFPQSESNTVRFVKQVLDEAELSTKFVSPKPMVNFTFTMLESDDYDLNGVPK